MRAYNLYHKETKINSKPLNRDAVDEILHNKIVSKKINDTQYKQFEVKDLRIVECILV